MFDHQITLKGLNFIGGLPEHIIKKAHLDAADVMGAAGAKGEAGSGARAARQGGCLPLFCLRFCSAWPLS